MLVNSQIFRYLQAKSLSALFICLMMWGFNSASAQDTINAVKLDNPTIVAGPTPDQPSLSRLQFEKGGEFEKKGKYKQASEYYGYSLDASPPNSDIRKFALYRRATCYFKQKIYDLALRDAMSVPNIIIKQMILVPAKDAVKLSFQYDHDAYIMTGLTKGLTKLGEPCEDYKKAQKIEGSPLYKGNKDVQELIKKYCH